MSQLVNLKSRLDHPVRISYEDRALMIPPRGEARRLEEAKLGRLPNGVIKIPVTSQQSQ